MLELKFIGIRQHSSSNEGIQKLVFTSERYSNKINSKDYSLIIEELISTIKENIKSKVILDYCIKFFTFGDPDGKMQDLAMNNQFVAIIELKVQSIENFVAKTSVTATTIAQKEYNNRTVESYKEERCSHYTCTKCMQSKYNGRVLSVCEEHKNCYNFTLSDIDKILEPKKMLQSGSTFLPLVPTLKNHNKLTKES